MQNKTKRLTESAMLIALAVVLEIVGRTVIPPMPFGGQLTLVSMLPIVLISYRHGVKWGITAGFAYSLVQMALGADTVTAAFQPGYFGDGTQIFNAVIMCLFDYVLAYSALGLGGCQVLGEVGAGGIVESDADIHHGFLLCVVVANSITHFAGFG